ncbi:MAG: branched-chain amino acid ABC transporter permease [Firmicutes bacterium]|nr:branched-chain amino acid ABC transporter permease [Bacillota bacterium]
MTFEVFIQQLLNGLTLGGLYSLIAIGYTMVYGILQLINFAHGDIFMVATYFAFYLVAVFALPWWAAALLTLGLTAMVGVLVERVAYRPLRNEPRISLLITAIGVSFFIENLAIVTVGARPKGFPTPKLMSQVIDLGGIRMSGVSIWVPLLSSVLLVLLLFIVYRTKVGMAMRAVSKDVEATRLMGVNVDRIIMYAFALGSALAAAGGMMWASKYPQIQPLMGVYPGWKAFTAAVVGGIGNIVGATIGGFIIGIAEIMTIAFLPQLSGYRDAFVFAILILVLLVKPSGLLGQSLKEKV